MRILKFEGATMREAVAKVKAELGDQAVEIIATRQVRSGLLGTAIEISAAIDDDDAPAKPYTRAATQPVAPKPETPDLEKLVGPLRSEMRSLRALVRTSGESRGNAELRAELAALRKLVEDGRLRETAAPQSRANTPLVQASTARIIMLAGPTGAGKTTTIAKLAARAALIENKRVKLITLDTYRVGGIEQIKTFADLIGVPLEVVENPSDLETVLDDDYDLALIDTAGRSPRDTAAIDELAAIMVSLPPIELHIVVPAAYSAVQIDSLVARYRKLAPARLLFTKIDEVDQAPELATAPARTRLPITWVTNGQAVPEDLEEPTAERILEIATPSQRKAAS